MLSIIISLKKNSLIMVNLFLYRINIFLYYLILLFFIIYYNISPKNFFFFFFLKNLEILDVSNNILKDFNGL